jgi:hypothetical protein
VVRVGRGGGRGRVRVGELGAGAGARAGALAWCSLNGVRAAGLACGRAPDQAIVFDGCFLIEVLSLEVSLEGDQLFLPFCAGFGEAFVVIFAYGIEVVCILQLSVSEKSVVVQLGSCPSLLFDLNEQAGFLAEASRLAHSMMRGSAEKSGGFSEMIRITA